MRYFEDFNEGNVAITTLSDPISLESVERYISLTGDSLGGHGVKEYLEMINIEKICSVLFFISKG